MKKLISMTDFVLEQQETIASDEITQADWYDIEATKLQKVRNYANFLKQPLKLEMFVPCDEDGNVLEKPSVENSKYIDDNYAWNDFVNHYKLDADRLIFNKANEKVLFEGFVLSETKITVRKLNKDKLIECQIPIKTICSYKDLEHFQSFHEKLELTESAIKQIL